MNGSVPSRVRRWTAALVCLVAATAGGRLASAGDDGKAAEYRFERRSPAEDLRRAVAERTVFDGIALEFTPDSQECVVRRVGSAIPLRDWTRMLRPGCTPEPSGARSIVGQLRELDGQLADLAHFRRLTDDELKAQLSEHCGAPPDKDYGDWQRDQALLEMLRRGGDGWIAPVRTALARVDAWRAEATTSGDPRASGAQDLELLIALRRLEGKPDSVRMEITPPDGSAYPELPVVKLRLVNRDARAVKMSRRSGNGASGRDGRCHVELRDAAGRVLPSRAWLGDGPISVDCGYIRIRESLAPGESMGAELPLSQFAATLQPGEYEVRIHYCDWRPIATPDDFLRVVTVDSAPFKIHVARRVVETTRSLQRWYETFAKELPAEGTVQILDGPYDAWAHRFIRPGSAAAELIEAGWAAVPVLTRLAARTDENPVRRAWAFAILETIAGELVERDDAAMGAYAVRFGTAGPDGKGGVTYGGSMECVGGRCDADAQSAQARAWASVASFVDLALEE